jgi:riboflavin kinase/FMN adenylyltransferase
MQLLRNLEDLMSVRGPTHVAIGVFDGLHLGHQTVIGRAVHCAEETGGSAVVVTFEPHPVRVLRPEKAPRLLMAPVQKRKIIEKLGATAMLVIPFTHEFARTRPEDFFAKLYSSANDLRQICVGDGWRFGSDRSGNTSLLKQLVEGLGIRLTTIPTVMIDGAVASSTRVRAAVKRGDLDEVSRLLGRPFGLCSIVATESPVLWAGEIHEMDCRTEDETDFSETVF